ncbi:MAG: cytochrome c oxidase assembly protein [Firmicutes bacterium]|nr:cytochrome c oxidase assembly protein [Bacillota bacterium]
MRTLGGGSGWPLQPHTVAWVLLPLYAYLRALPQLRPSGWEAARFLAGVVALFVALISPLHVAADSSSFLLHVIQHMLLQMVAPPLLLSGIPRQARARLAAHPGMVRAGAVLLHPLVAAGAYNAVLLLWHWPLPAGHGELRLACGILTDLATRSPVVAVLQDILPLVAGLLFWSAIMLAPPLSRSSPPARVAMLLGSMVLNWLLSFSLAYADTPMYATYAGTRPPFGLSLLADQKLGAGVMWEHGNMTYVVALVLWLRALLRQAGTSVPSGPSLPLHGPRT